MYGLKAEAKKVFGAQAPSFSPALNRIEIRQTSAMKEKHAEGFRIAAAPMENGLLLTFTDLSDNKFWTLSYQLCRTFNMPEDKINFQSRKIHLETVQTGAQETIAQSLKQIMLG